MRQHGRGKIWAKAAWFILWMAGCCTILQAEDPPPPKGVILVLIDDIGYGDMDILYPSGLETPNLDTLYQNIDDNMGRLDAFLAAEGLKDDVLLIFTTDNGTTGGRRGGLRGAKSSLFDGGHNVPCYWRWKNGGMGGSTALARDVQPLSAAMDLLPTFVDLFGLTRPDGGQPLHGISLKQMLLDPDFVPADRTLVVDTQRLAELVKWRLACVAQDEVSDGKIKHKWRLIRGSANSRIELYDFHVDRGQDHDVAAANDAIVAELVEQGTDHHEAIELALFGGGVGPGSVRPQSCRGRRPGQA